MAVQTSRAVSPYAAELAHWRDLLLRHRAEAEREMRSGIREARDAAEGAAPARTLRLIDRALRKIAGEGPLPFGVCERMLSPIARERLALVPWTPVSLEGAAWLEERFMTLDDLLAGAEG